MTHPPAAIVFGKECLDELTAAAKASARGRKNRDFHAQPSHPAQRLLNAVEPGSYVRPHRHVEPHKDETFVVIRGSFGLLFFDEQGSVTKTAIVGGQSDLIGAHIPHGVFHSLVSLESGSVFFEAKAGPYDATTDKELAPWAPAEGGDGAAEYYAKLCALFAAERSVANRKSTGRELPRLLRHDDAGGTNEPQWFMELAQREFDRAQRYRAPLCALLLNIDQFEDIKAARERAAVDETSRAVTDTCLAIFRKTDLFARIGEKDFAAVLPMARVSGALVIAEELRARLGEVSVFTGTRSLSFTVSIGVSEWREHDAAIDSLLDRARAALHTAQNLGGDRVASA